MNTSAYLGITSVRKSVRFINGEVYTVKTNEYVYTAANSKDGEDFIKAVNKLEDKVNRQLTVRELTKLSEYFYKRG